MLNILKHVRAENKACQSREHALVKILKERGLFVNISLNRCQVMASTTVRNSIENSDRR
jgi:hypothetical protein